MAKKSKLLTALDAHKGRDYEAEKRKKLQKAAEKRKRSKQHNKEEVNGVPTAEELEDAVVEPATAAEDFEEFESVSEDDEDQEDGGANGIIPQPEIAAEASASEAEQESDVDYSDLEEEDREDVVPHQRMTINNAAALISSRKRVAIVSDKPKHPFHFHNSIISSDQKADELIPDAMDDETRELMFYKIARDATVSARDLLKKEKVPFSRPADYFAEMAKNDDHMGKVKKKLHDEASSKRAAEEARRLRDAKKFGKQVQLAKEQERARDKKDTLNKIKELKRSEWCSLQLHNLVLTCPQNEKTMTQVESPKVITCSRRLMSTMRRLNRNEIGTVQLGRSVKRKMQNLASVAERGSQSQAQPRAVLI